MIPYIILLSLLLLFTTLYYRDQRFEGLYQLFTFILLVGFAGLRIGLGQDYEVYENGYNWVQSESFEAFEPLWRSLILGMRAMGLSFRSFMILTSAITIALFFRGIQRLSISYPLGILFFVLFNTGYLETLNGVRQCLALMITFAAFHLYVERRYWRFFLWVVLSCLVHSSSVIWLLLLPLMSIRWDRRVLTALLVVTLAVGNPLFKVVGSVLEPILPERYAFYISTEGLDTHQGWINVLTQNGMALLLLIGSLYLDKERDRVTHLAILLIAFSSMIYNCTLSSSVAMRFMYNPGIMICVALPNLLLSVKDRWYQLAIAGVMILYFLFTVNNVMDPGSSLHTYRWIYDDYIYTPYTMVINESTSPRAIAFVVSQIRPQGPLFVVRDIVAGLPEGYYKPYIIQLCSLEPQGEAMADELQAMGCEIIELGFTRGQLELFPRSAARLLDECLQHYDITLVHSHTYQPDIVTSYLTHRYILLTTQHNIAKLDFTYGKGRLIGGYMCRRLMRALSRHREVVCVSHACRDYYRKSLPTKVNVYVAPNGIDNTLFTPPVSPSEQAQLRRQLALPEGGYIITYCGGLIKRKDPELILRALRLLKRRNQLPRDLRLLILGKGPLERRCKQLAKPLGEQVLFVGFTDRVADYLGASDALITASHAEGLPLNVIEGVASGCVVIHSNLPIFGEILGPVPQMAALRFDLGNVSQCADCILKAPSVTFDRQEALEMGRLYGRQRMALQYHRIYQQLLRKYLG